MPNESPQSNLFEIPINIPPWFDWTIITLGMLQKANKIIRLPNCDVPSVCMWCVCGVCAWCVGGVLMCFLKNFIFQFWVPEFFWNFSWNTIPNGSKKICFDLSFDLVLICIFTEFLDLWKYWSSIRVKISRHVWIICLDHFSWIRVDTVFHTHYGRKENIWHVTQRLTFADVEVWALFFSIIYVHHAQIHVSHRSQPTLKTYKHRPIYVGTHRSDRSTWILQDH